MRHLLKVFGASLLLASTAHAQTLSGPPGCIASVACQAGSLAINGASIGSNALALTGTSLMNGSGIVPPLSLTGTGPASSTPSVGLFAVPWNSTGVVAIRPNIAAAGGTLDILANGANQDSWIDIGSDYTIDQTNGEFLEVRKTANGYASLLVKALGPSTMQRSLVFQPNGTSLQNIGFNTTTPTEQYHAKFDVNGKTAFVAENASTGTSAYATFEARNAANANSYARIAATGTSFTTNGGFVQNSAAVEAGSNLTGGMSFITRNASGPMRFYTGDFATANLRLTLPATGGMLVAGHLAFSGSAPAVSACGSGSAIDASATDNSGTVTVGSVATSCTVTFANAYSTFNHCRVTSQSSISGLAYSYTLSAIIVSASVLGADKFDYACDGT